MPQPYNYTHHHHLVRFAMERKHEAATTSGNFPGRRHHQTSQREKEREREKRRPRAVFHSRALGRHPLIQLAVRRSANTHDNSIPCAPFNHPPPLYYKTEREREREKTAAHALDVTPLYAYPPRHNLALRERREGVYKGWS